MTTLEANPVTQTTNEVLLEASGLKKHFPVTKGLLVSKVTGWIKAVDGVSFQIRAGETLGIVGESGCGQKHHRQDAPAIGRTHRGHHSLPGG